MRRPFFVVVLAALLAVAGCYNEQDMKRSYRRGYAAGKQEGYAAGHRDGKAQGYRQGYEKGESKGYREGTVAFVGNTLWPSAGMIIVGFACLSTAALCVVLLRGPVRRGITAAEERAEEGRQRRLVRKELSRARVRAEHLAQAQALALSAQHARRAALALRGEGMRAELDRSKQELERRLFAMQMEAIDDTARRYQKVQKTIRGMRGLRRADRAAAYRALRRDVGPHQLLPTLVNTTQSSHSHVEG